MCGIAGYISKKESEKLPETIDRMLNIIIHRGPDGSGRYIYKDRVGLGHRRLSILDLSDNGAQPMTYRGRFHITFNGEIYNYIELREELEKKGYSFYSDTDTEVLLASYAEWGDECVSRFNGMWAFAVFDEEKNHLFCSRDRYGVKPFYYYYDENSMIFGSEIKEILSVMPGQIQADMDHLSAYLAKGSLDYDEGTLFKGVKQLSGGYNLYIDCENLHFSVVRFYDLRQISCSNLAQNHLDQKNLTKEENYKCFKEKFLKSVRLRLRSDVQVGSCLSGGLDSSAIVCAVHEELKHQGKEEQQYTVSSCFDDRRYDEREYIDEVVKHTGIISYKVFPDMGKVFEKLDQIIWHMDEPFAGTSVYAQWCVFEEAKKRGLAVMLDGQGSDEQLAGYTPFYKVLFIDLFRKGQWKRLRREINAYRTLRSESEPVPYREVLLSTIGSLLFPDHIRYRINKIYHKKISGRPLPERMYQGKDLEESYRSYDKRNPQKYIYAGMYHGLRTLLHYEDRNSMAHSIESRVPFLDYELAEFIYSVPLEQKIENGRTKNLLREGLRAILPDTIYNRISKLGFVTPEDQWLKDNEEFFYGELEKACDRLGSVLDKKQVLDWYKTHVQSTRMGDSTCFRIICAAHWADVFDVKVEYE